MCQDDGYDERRSDPAASPHPPGTDLKQGRGTGSSPGSRTRSLLYPGSAAGQVFVLQILIVVLLVVAGVIALLLYARQASVQEAREKSLSAARAFANAPGMVAALDSRNPTAVLQPRAVAARQGTGLEWIIVVDAHGSALRIPTRSTSVQRRTAP